MASSSLDPRQDSQLADRLDQLSISDKRDQEPFEDISTDECAIRPVDTDKQTEELVAPETGNLPLDVHLHEQSESSTIESKEKQVSYAVLSDKALRLLEVSSPKNQIKALNVLVDETIAQYRKQSKLSPQKLAREGLVAYDLTPESISPSKGGYQVLRLKRPSMAKRGGRLRLQKGQDVILKKQFENPDDKKQRRLDRSSSSSSEARGLLSEIFPDSFELAVSEKEADIMSWKPIQMEGIQQLAVYERMIEACEIYESNELGEHNCEELLPLAKLARGYGKLRVARSRPLMPTRLNPSQVLAMENALGSNVCLIRGPPGTGKTAVLYEIIRNLLDMGENILICCGSHAAVDNLLAKFVPHARDYPIVRLGHPHRVGKTIRPFTVPELIHDKEFAPKSTRIVATTLHGTWDIDDQYNLHTIVVDEVCQAFQAQTWIPLLRCAAHRLIVAGDDMQLPPTITCSKDMVKEIMEVTLFDVLLSCYGDEIVHLLDTQYRMSDSIMQFPSGYMYEGKLRADKSNATQKLSDIRKVVEAKCTSAQVVWIDTSPLGYTEETTDRGLIKNSQEAQLVKLYCSILQRKRVDLKTVGVISPYVHQKNVLISMVPRDVEISTIDGFQGQEKNVIIISLVRSNATGSIGFLSDERRLNVAITRAKYQLCIVASMSTMKRSTSAFLNEWVDWCEKYATILYATTSESIEGL